AFRVHDEPQLCRAPGAKRPHASGKPSHGGRRGDCRSYSRPAQARVMAMQKFTQVSETAAPIMKANIDTDVIIPAKRLVGHKREELAAFAFEALRYRPDGSDNPDFVLNMPRYRGASVLITGENFGCGSSRESAVWAMAGFGFRCVIAPSFGDIFYN